MPLGASAPLLCVPAFRRVCSEQRIYVLCTWQNKKPVPRGTGLLRSPPRQPDRPGNFDLRGLEALRPNLSASLPLTWFLSAEMRSASYMPTEAAKKPEIIQLLLKWVESDIPIADT